MTKRRSERSLARMGSQIEIPGRAEGDGQIIPYQLLRRGNSSAAAMLMHANFKRFCLCMEDPLGIEGELENGMGMTQVAEM